MSSNVRFESVQFRIQGTPAAVTAAYEQLKAVVVAPSPLNMSRLRDSEEEWFGRFSAAVAVPEGATANAETIVVGEVAGGRAGRGRASVRGGHKAIGGGSR